MDLGLVPHEFCMERARRRHMAMDGGCQFIEGTSHRSWNDG